MRNLLCVTPLFPSKEKPFYCIYLLQQLHAMENYGFNVSVLVPVKSNQFSVVEEEFDNIRVIRLRYINIGYEFKTFVDKEIDEHDYDIISLNLCNLKLISYFTKSCKVPTVVHFHGLNVWENYYEPHPLLAKLIKYKKIYVYRKADAVVGVSDKVRTVAMEYLPAESVYTVYNGVNPSLFYPRQKEQKETFDIYCVANLIMIKGHEYLIRALKKVKEQISDIKIQIHIIGDGPYRTNLVDLCCQLGLDESVVFEGEMKYYDIADRISADCDMFIMPSFYESLGCVYLEAMACEVPTVGVRGCGIDEVIKDGYNGFLVDPKNSNQIAEKIIWVVNNPEKAKTIATQGRRTIMDGFTWDDSGGNLAAVYERIITRDE